MNPFPTKYDNGTSKWVKLSLNVAPVQAIANTVKECSEKVI